jgi:hypothetical protein
LDAAYAELAAALAAWSGGRAHAWTAADALEPGGEGATYSRRDDLNLFLERTQERVALGAALTERDRDLLRVELSRNAPARRKQRAAIAVDENNAFYLLLGADWLRDQQLRDPVRRLAGAPLLKRAELAERDYLLAGPLSDPRIGDALCAIAGLAPAFEKHVVKLGSLIADEDEAQEEELYPISRSVARAHRVQGRVIAALHQRLRAAGYQSDVAEAGALKADFAMSRGAETLVFEVRAHAEIADLVRGLGQLTLVAPRPAHLTRFFVLPAPRGEIGQALTPFMPAFEELSVSVLLYDLERDEIDFRFERVDPSLNEETRRLFP